MIGLVIAVALPFSVPNSIYAPGGKAEASDGSATRAGVDWMKENGFEIAEFDPGRNLFVNGSFESGVRYWRTSWTDPETPYVTTNNPHSGSRCWQFFRTFYSVGTVLKPNTTYTISGWIRDAKGRKGKGVSVHPRGLYGRGGFLDRVPGFCTKEATTEWQYCQGSFKTKPWTHEVVIWFENGVDTDGSIFFDDIRLVEGEKPGTADNLMGLELVTGSPDNLLVDATRPSGEVKLAVHGPKGAKGTLEVRARDFFERELFTKTFGYDIGESGETLLKLGDDADFPKGVVGFKVKVSPDPCPLIPDSSPYTDFLRFAKFKPATNRERHKNLCLTPDGSAYSWSVYSSRPPKPPCEMALKRIQNLGFGGFKYSDQYEDDMLDAMEKYRIDDCWGAVRRVQRGTKVKSGIDGWDMKWEGVDVTKLEDYPEAYLKLMEEHVCNQAKANPRVLYWSWDSEPAGKFKSLLVGNVEAYARLMLAIGRGIRRANPKAVFCPYGSWNMANQGRADVINMLATMKQLDPAVEIPSIEMHSYREFPEHPDVENDLKAFLESLDRIGCSETKIKIGEGSYYYTMARPSLDGPMPWMSVSSKDGYFWVACPSYDLGWGEKIGAALTMREWLVYYKYGDRVWANCTWNPRALDNDTFFAWVVMNTALKDFLGDATFKAESRFALDARAMVFDDAHGSAVAVVWKADEQFDRGKAGASTVVFDLGGLDVTFFDMMGNEVKVEGEGEQRRVRIPLSGYPFYLKTPVDQLNRLVEMLNGGRVREDEGRLLLRTAMQLTAADRATVKVINPLTRPLAAKMRVGAAEYDVSLKGGEERPLEVTLPEKVRADSFGKVRVPVTFDFEGKSFDETFEAAAVAVQYVPGEKPDWPKVPSVKMPRFIKYDEKSSHPGRGANFDADVKLAWNEKHLFLRFEVADDKFCFVENEVPEKWGYHWNWDAIQLFFDSFGNAGGAARRGIFGHDYDDFSYELYPASPTNAVCFRRFAPDHQLTGGAGYGFVGNRLEPDVKVGFTGKDGKLVYDVDFPVYYLMPLKLEAGVVSPGLGIEIYDRDDPKVGSPVKLSNVSESSDGRRDAMNNPHLYPQLILAK